MVRILAADTSAEMQASGPEPQPAAPGGTAEGLEVLDQEGPGDVLAGLAGIDVTLDAPIELDIPIWAEGVDDDHERARLTPRRFRLDGAFTSSEVSLR